MYHTDIGFQAILFFAFGILFGGMLKHLFFSLIFIFFYEFYVFHISRFYPPSVRELDRILLNVIYIFGWILGHILMFNKTGVEELIEFFD
jgi:hypothetical protein